jgi:hypothetical protein
VLDSPRIPLLRAIVRRPITYSLSVKRARKIHAIADGYCLIIRAARPLVDVGAAVAAHWALVSGTAGDSICPVEAQLRALLVAESPGRDRVGLRPQADVGGPGRILCGGIGCALCGRLFPLELLVVPGHPGPDLVKADVLAVEEKHATDFTAVALLLLAVEPDGFPKDQRRQTPARTPPERLVVFGSVYAGQTNGELSVARVQDTDRVTVGDADYPEIPAFQAGSQGQTHHHECQKEQTFSRLAEAP